ncbi:MAG: 23S rRNA (uracil(1939)-C(5))-methyltransferase RlmD [Alteromonadaceae bacterium]|nr:23S rRNA (uracil(1939)-C(5))-methyltransferase RlmD [Alteromonadaceae bacterium]
MANFFKASNKKQSLGQSLKIKVERLDINGCGVGRHQNKPVFIDGALPGEVVSVKIIEQKGKYYRARLLNVDQSHQHRISPKCRHFNICGGCDLQHLAFSEHNTFKQQKVTELFARNALLDDLPWQPSIIGKAWNYRRKARIGVQYDKNGRATIGFRQKGTNTLAAIKSCPVLVEPFADIFDQLKPLLAQLTVYQSIGHIEVIATEHLTLVVRQLKPLNDEDTKLWLKYSQQYHWQVFINNGKEINAITPSSPLHYTLSENPLSQNIELVFDVNNFIQVNHQVNVEMVNQAIDWLDLNQKDKVLDLFCGLGNFSLPMAQKVQQVIGVEGVHSMVEQASNNAKASNIDNCYFYQADLSENWISERWAQYSFTKVLLDPARSGAYEAVCQIVKLKIPQILYVSCEPTTLAKDCQYLLSKGYKIEKIGLMEMFAQTKHVETMVLFKKSDNIGNMQL